MSSFNPSFHSKYNPNREARRFIDARLGNKHPSLILLLAAGECYLVEELKNTFPGSFVAVLQPASIFDDKIMAAPDAYWSPASGQPASFFLSGILSAGWAQGGIAFLEWSPVAEAFPGESAFLRNTILEEIKKENALSATRSFWASTWLHNSIAFWQTRTAFAIPSLHDAPIVIACAGPSLEKTIPFIRMNRKRIILFSVSGAHSILARQGIIPDIVVSTDPGFWANLHLREFTSKSSARSPLLAATPSARIPKSILEKAEIIPLDSGLVFDRTGFEVSGSESIVTGPSGTVTGIAINLALKLSTAPVFVAGLDLAFLDIFSHAKGYAFESIYSLKSARLSPEYNNIFQMSRDGSSPGSGNWRQPRAFSVYESELASLFSGNSRLYRLYPSGSALPGNTASAENIASVFRAERRGIDFRIIENNKPGISAYLELIKKNAIESVDRAWTNKTPLDEDGLVSLLALGGREFAPLITTLARRTARQDEIKIAYELIEKGAE